MFPSVSALKMLTLCVCVCVCVCVYTHTGMVWFFVLGFFFFLQIENLK